MTQGIYIIKGASGRPIYIGSSVDVERRVKEHAAKKSWWFRVREVSVIPTDSWEEALRVERVLIREINPTYNTQSLHPSIRLLRQIARSSDLNELVKLHPRRRKALNDITGYDIADLIVGAPGKAEAHRIIPVANLTKVLAHGTIGAAVEAGAFHEIEAAA